MKKKNIFIFSLIFVLIISLIIINSKNNKLYDVNKNQIKKDNNRLSMMLETGIETGEYEISTSDKWPSSGYTFNSELSKCENGGELSWDSVNKAVVMSGNKSDKCYIYFDKDFVKLSLDNYTFKWDTVEGASTYQIYSDGELLTTTSDTSAEIYGLYNEAGNYEIGVKALDGSGNLVNESNLINYGLMQTNVSLSSKFINYKEVYKQGKENCDLYDECWILPNNFAGCLYIDYNETITYDMLIDNNYDVELFHIKAFGGSYVHLPNLFKWAWLFNFSVSICENSSECFNGSLNALDYSYASMRRIYYDNSSKVLKMWANGGNSECEAVFIRFVQAGKAYTDWYIMGMKPQCLSSNTDVYAYDKKKKRFKKKKISEVDYDDELLCWDFDNGCFAVAKPIWIMKEKQTFKYNRLTFSDGSILETINQHRIFNVEKGMFTYPMTDDTPIGTTTLNANGEYVKLISKEEVEAPIIYYNVMTSYHINLFANDILTSSRLSNIYPIKDLKYVCKKKRNNEYDFSSYNKNLVKGLRLNEQNIEEKEIKKYADNMLKIKK